MLVLDHFLSLLEICSCWGKEKCAGLHTCILYKQVYHHSAKQNGNAHNHRYQAVTYSFDGILSFRSPHYACPEVIRVSWLILVYKNTLFEVSLIASTQLDPLYKESAQGRGKENDTRNLKRTLFVWLSPESSHYYFPMEIIACYSHSTFAPCVQIEVQEPGLIWYFDPRDIVPSDFLSLM